jgi:hypothetical protein
MAGINMEYVNELKNELGQMEQLDMKLMQTHRIVSEGNLLEKTKEHVFLLKKKKKGRKKKLGLAPASFNLDSF